MSRIRRIHDKEIKALERKCQIKNDKLRVDLMGGKFKCLKMPNNYDKQRLLPVRSAQISKGMALMLDGQFGLKKLLFLGKLPSKFDHIRKKGL